MPHHKKTALLFPGQGKGSVFPGMGKKVLKSAQGRQIFHEMGRVLNMDILSLCVYESEETLQRTDNSQIASLATSLGHMEILRERGMKALDDPETVCAGNSIGELAAGVFAGAVRCEDSFLVVQARGAAMHQACLESPSKMLVGLNRDPICVEDIEKICKGSDGVTITNYNSATQIVIGGPIAETDKIAAELEGLGLIRKFVDLKAAGAYHNKQCMEIALEVFGETLKQIEILEPERVIVSNQGKQITSAKAFRQELEQGIVRPVLWYRRSKNGKESGVVPMLQACGVQRCLEVGAGDVLTKLIGTPFKRKIAGAIGGALLLGTVVGSAATYVAVRRGSRS
jgi:[acyl-carrier-protein] S-malonyltransferase